MIDWDLVWTIVVAIGVYQFMVIIGTVVGGLIVASLTGRKAKVRYPTSGPSDVSRRFGK
jgi:hypothetical protein